MSETTLVGRFSEALREAWRRRRSLGDASILQSATGPKADLLFLRARAMARSGAMEMAENLYAHAADLEPTFAEAFEGQGEVLDLSGHRALAMQKYETARKTRAGVRLGAPDRHFVLRQRGRFVAEIMAYDSVLRSLKKNTLPYLARGNAYLATGRPEEALADYGRALKLKPNVPAVTVLRAEALSMMGRYVEALKAFDTALAKHPDDAEALSGRAIARIALGRVDEANADWRRQFELLGDRATARACVALRLADYALALPQLDCALQKEPADPYWHLYRMAAQHRLDMPVISAPEWQAEVWPGPLLALHAGRMSEDEVLRKADNADRRAEALFQMGVLSFARNRSAAQQHWREIVERALPSLIEHAAARNELSRLGS